MQYTTLGDSGLIVSRLAFGAMTFTSGYCEIPSLFKVGIDLADQLVGQALDAGINLFDTADVYARGQSEEMLGHVIGQRRNRMVICTKVGGRFGSDLNDAGLSRRHIMASVDASLKRLGTSWIDLYVVHREDPYTPMEETLTALDDVVRAGKVRYLGFSNWAAWRVAAAMDMMQANGLARFTHGQMYYSLLCRDIETEIVPMMQHYGLGLTVWSPLAGGFLTGKYRRDGGDEEAVNRLSSFDMLPINRAQAFPVIDAMTSIAQSHGASVAQIAIAWLLAKQAVSSIILGATKSQQLADTLGAADVSLSAAEVAALDEVAAREKPYPAWLPDRFGDRLLEKALNR